MKILNKRSILLCMQLLIVTMFLYSLLFGVGAAEDSSKPKAGCVDSGACHLCNDSEMNLVACAATGKKIKIICNGYDTNEFRSCDLTSEDQQYRVLLFQGAMAIIGSLAFWGVQSRKNKNLTLFENRKLRNREI